MRCLYEVLEIERTAEEDAIKKAYRKQALIWHPDKNAHRAEEAAERFKEVQNAYEVLSDKHERAWYDTHRDRILASGGRHQAGGSGFDDSGPQRPADEEDLFQYFTSSCFSGFGDGPKGFYGVYDALFEKLAQQEARAWEERAANGESSDPEEAGAERTWPRFGTSDSDAATVNAFYAHWSHFSTAKSFAWAHMYNPASAPNRQVRRRMDEENRKAARAARKDYNENVRELVAFIKKRDQRAAKFAAEEAARRAEREAAELERRQREKAERAARAAAYEEADWIKASEAEARQLEEEQEEEEQEQEEFYCVACDKSFKSDKQLANHQKSKKHLEAVAALKALLEEEEGLEASELLEQVEGLGASAAEPRTAQPARDNSVQQEKRGKKKKKKKLAGPATHSAPAQDDDQEEEEDLNSPPGVTAESREEDIMVGATQQAGEGSDGEYAAEVSQCEPDDKSEDRGTACAGERDDSGGDEEQDEETAPEEEEEDEEAMLSRLLKQQTLAQGRQQGARKPGKQGGRVAGKETMQAVDGQPVGSGGVDLDAEADEEDLVVGGGRKGRKGKAKKAPPAGVSGAAKGASKVAGGGSASGGGGGTGESVQAVGAAASDSEEDGSLASTKREKRKAKAAARKASASAANDVLTCKVCGTGFPSRSQLFKHIQTTGHAALK